MNRIIRLLSLYKKRDQKFLCQVIQHRNPKSKKVDLLKLIIDHPNITESSARVNIYGSNCAGSKFSMLKERLFNEMVETMIGLCGEKATGSNHNLEIISIRNELRKADFLISKGSIEDASKILWKNITKAQSRNYYRECLDGIDKLRDIMFFKDSKELEELDDLYKRTTAAQSRLVLGKEAYHRAYRNGWNAIKPEQSWDDTISFLEMDYQLENSILAGYFYFHLRTLREHYLGNRRESIYLAKRLINYINKHEEIRTTQNVATSLSLSSLVLFNFESYWHSNRAANLLLEYVQSLPVKLNWVFEIICRSHIRNKPERSFDLAITARSHLKENNWPGHRLIYIEIVAAIKLGEYKHAMKQIKTFDMTTSLDPTLKGWLYVLESVVHAERRHVSLLDNTLEALRKYESRNLSVETNQCHYKIHLIRRLLRLFMLNDFNPSQLEENDDDLIHEFKKIKHNNLLLKNQLVELSEILDD